MRTAFRFVVVSSFVVTAGSLSAEMRTCTWIEPTPGNYGWNDASRWQDGVLPGASSSITNSIDFSALASGSVVTNDIAKEINVSKVTFSGRVGDTWSLVQDKRLGGGPFSFVGDAEMEIVGGTLHSAWNMAPWGKTVKKTGSGCWAIGSDSWNTITVKVEEGTVCQENGGSLYQTLVNLSGPNTTYTVSPDGKSYPLCQLLVSGAEGQRVQIDKSKLYVGAGHYGVAGSIRDVTLTPDLLSGNGSLSPINSSTLTVKDRQQDFKGTYRVMNGTTEVLGALTDEVIAFYRFEGSVTADTSSHGNTLTAWRYPTVVNDPERGEVAKFVQTKKIKADGSKEDKQQQLLGAASANHGLNVLPVGDESFTIALWLKVQVDNVIEGYEPLSWNNEPIFGFGTNVAGRASLLRLQRDGANGGYLMYTNHGNNQYFGDQTLVDGSWHHIGIVNGAGGKVKIYVDGRFVVENTVLKSRNIPSGGAFEIGFAGNSVGNWAYFNGCLDDFIIVRGEVDPVELMNLDERWIASNSRPVEIDPDVRLEGALGGKISLLDGSHTVAGLSGTGVFSDIHSAGDLTVARTSGVDDFNSRLTGSAKLVKDGTGYELRVSGSLEHTGGTEVNGGTLVLKGAGAYKGALCEWNFENPENPGEDTGVGHMTLFPTAGEGVKVVTDAVRGKVAYFDGTGALSNKTYCAGFPQGNSSYTFSLWVKPEDMNGHQTGGIVSWGQSWGNGTEFIGRMDKEAAVMFTHYGDNWTVGSRSAMMDGGWHHLVYRYDAEAGEKAVFVDGQKQEVPRAPLNISLVNPLFLGRNFLNNDTSGFYTGWMDDVHLYGYALSDEQVARAFSDSTVAIRTYDKNERDIPAPVVKFDFEDADDLGKDVTENPIASLKAKGEVASVVDAERGRVLDLTAGYGCLEAESFPAKVPNGNLSVTVSAWVKATSTTANGSKYWASVLDYGATDSHLLFGIYNEHRKAVTLQCYTWGAVARISWLDGFGGTQIDKWHHIVATRTSGKMRVFLDGTPVGSYDNSSMKTCGTDYFYLGRTHLNGTQWFNGYIDDVEIYDSVLTDAQIAELCLRESNRGTAKNRLPVGSALAVGSAGTVSVQGSEESLGTVSGSGTITVAPGSVFMARDMSAFTGTVQNYGTVTVPSDVELNGTAPAVQGVIGAVTIPATGTVHFAGSAEEVRPGKYLIATGTSVSAPSGLAGWTAFADERVLNYSFVIKGGAFYCHVHPRGLQIIVR